MINSWSVENYSTCLKICVWQMYETGWTGICFTTADPSHLISDPSTGRVPMELPGQPAIFHIKGQFPRYHQANIANGLAGITTRFAVIHGLPKLNQVTSL